MNPALNDAANKQQIELVKVGVNPSGMCNTTATRNYGFYNAAAGHESLETLTTPVLIAPTAGKKYDLALYTVVVTTTPSYYVGYSITGYVRLGAYSGMGVAPNTARSARSAKILKRAVRFVKGLDRRFVLLKPRRR